jgi:hypothetical protein
MQITSLKDFLKIQDYAAAEATSFQVFEIGPWLAMTNSSLG